MIVVADTSPINYLVQLDRMELLRSQFGQVLVPEEVFLELTAAGTPDSVRQWVKNRPDWFRVEVAPPMRVGIGDRLDPGERAAIHLALEMRTKLIIDERKGKHVATSLGIESTGTVGLLMEAAQLGRLELETELKTLQILGFHMTDEYLQQCVRAAAKS